MDEVGEFVKIHQPCPDCGSHDALSVRADGSTLCFSCGAKHNGNKRKEVVKKVSRDIVPEAGRVAVNGIPDRGITADTCAKYGVRVVVKAHGIAQHIYPYYDSAGNLVAQKIRTVEGKRFDWTGQANKAGLFGQNLFPSSGKYITVCEGEIDAMSIYQMQGSQYPVVSVRNGAGGVKDIKEAYEYLNGFEHIVLCFDSDDAGNKGMSRIAEILPPKKVRIVKLPPDMKDANEFLKAGKIEEFKRLWWKQEEFRPADIVNIGDMFGRVMEYRKSHQYIPTPWQGLNDIITGTRPGQIVIIAAGSGQGKSAILKTWMSYLQHTAPDMKIGSLYLEENPEDTVVNLMSLEAGLNLKKPDVWDAQSEDDLKKYFEQCGAERSIELFEPIENTEPDYITEKIRYLAQARECKIIFFDHITYVVDDSEDVKRDINKLMKNLHDMCVALNITVIAACHLRKAQGGKTHEEGGRVTLDDLKDSSSIKQLSDIVIGLERDSQAEDVVKANTTNIRVLKNRDFGVKGLSETSLLYDRDTTRLQEVVRTDEDFD